MLTVHSDQPGAGDSSRQWAVPLVLGAGLAAGWVGMLGWPAFPPTEAIHRLFYFVIAAALLGAVHSRWQSTGLRWGIRISLTAAVVWLFLAPIRDYEWEGVARWYWLCGLTAGMIGTWTSLAALAKRLPAVSILPPLIVVAGGTSATCLLSGFAKFAQLGGVLTAVLAVCWLVSRWRRSLTLAAGSADVVAVFLAGLWLGGYFFAEMPIAAAVLLALSPSMAWLGEFKPVHKLGPRMRLGLLIAVTAVPVTISIFLAFGEYIVENEYYG